MPVRSRLEAAPHGGAFAEYSPHRSHWLWRRGQAVAGIHAEYRARQGGGPVRDLGLPS
jgi:hypothetical protein